MAAQLVTLLYGHRVPRCRQCGALKFEPVVIAHNASYYENLRESDEASSGEWAPADSGKQEPGMAVPAKAAVPVQAA